MTDVTDAEVGEVDLAVVAYRDEGDWSLSELPDRSLDDRGHRSPGSCVAIPARTARWR